ncbi:leucine-rich repeat domain-containing protein [Pseudoalteromonas luteoviolacea]|uniref:TIR domain-containing protein n=1 Tax=Pseudoalteromonas luteoviolacea H33 TaxID=1365251 RepID=A0A167DV40_9GAMM|nr:leucine-rich repeat domain-containing protein [Pseudoalteromonas luteoviolacea]KZN49403.1 hypothetical protein N476_19135 [Pseudoalteromonas luteoviolacea H33]KZN72664.1 hypothetical protein N477_25045 [Pseudoalteromonas luteoviolacea H33-S]
MLAEALRRIEQEKQEKTGRLNLNGLGLTALPEELFELVWLKELCLGVEFAHELKHNQGTFISRALFDDLKHHDTSGGESSFDELPEQIQRLSQLEVLIAEHCFEAVNLSLISELTSLRVLVLGDSKLLSQYGSVQLPNLAVLSLVRNTSFNSAMLCQLTELRYLDLCGNVDIQLAHLQHRHHLEWLELSNLDELDLNDLAGSHNLQYLKLSDCPKLKSNFPYLSRLDTFILETCQFEQTQSSWNLPKIETIELVDCVLGSLDMLRELTALIHLDISHSYFSDLSPLENLQNVRSLELVSCEIENISPINELNRIQKLKLSDNLISDLTGIEQLQNLTYLDLDNNAVCDITPLAKLSDLESLYLDDNLIKDITPIGQIKKLEHLKVSNNHFLTEHDLTLEPWDNHLDAIKNLLLQTTESHSQIKLPCKVLFLGNHSAGKSSLANYLQKQSLTEKTQSTHILSIQHYTCVDNRAASQQAIQNSLPDAIFYDFGGQDYYHGVYRVFMQQKVLTCLLWKQDCNGNQQATDSRGYETQHFSLAYWLAQWRGMTAPERKVETPLLLVQTHADQDPKQLVTSEPQSLTQHQFYVSLNDAGDTSVNQASLNYLHTTLDTFIEQSRRTVKGDKWYQDFIAYVLDRQQNRINNAHTYTRLGDLVKQYQAGSDNDRLHLQTELKKWHEQGLVLYYPSINKNKVWLNPQALTQFIHSHILSLKTFENSQGRIRKAQFDKLIKQHKIDKDVVELLKKEKVIFDHTHTDEIIIPNYLPLAKEEGDHYALYTFGMEYASAFTLKFAQFIPMGLINQLICYFGPLPESKLFWRNQLLFTLGVNKNDDGTKNTDHASKVLIKVEYHPHIQIKVYISGHNKVRSQHIRYLYFVIMAMYWDLDIQTDLKRFDSLFKQLKQGSSKKRTLELEEVTQQQFDHIKTVFETPPKDLQLSLDNRYFVSATELAEHSNSTQISAFDTQKNIIKNLDVEPYQPFTLKGLNKVLKVFISYCHDDIAQRQELELYLTNLVRNKQIEIWQDGLIQPGDVWHTEIVTALEEADVVIMLISQAFIASGYVHDVEVPKALKNLQDGSTKIFPVLLKDCDFADWHVWPEEIHADLENEEAVAMSQYQFFPQDEQNRLKPINQWDYPEKAWTGLTKALKQLIKDLNNA